MQSINKNDFELRLKLISRTSKLTSSSVSSINLSHFKHKWSDSVNQHTKIVNSSFGISYFHWHFTFFFLLFFFNLSKSTVALKKTKNKTKNEALRSCKYPLPPTPHTKKKRKENKYHYLYGCVVVSYIPSRKEKKY